jgi:GT2 family glycosyltransferase
MRFSVVIPTLGRADELRETLASLMPLRPHEVIVVDGDPARSAEPVVRDAGATFLTSEPGSSHQRNAGIRAATGDVVVFADDDVTFDAGVFAALDRVYGDPSVVGATGLVIEPASHRFGGKESLLRRLVLGGAREGTFTRAGYPVYIRRTSERHDVEVMPGCFMSARRELAEQVGFDEKLPGYALAEDEDFSFRLSRLGRLRYEPAASITHRKLGFSTQDRRAFSRRVAVNRAYLFRKNFPQTPLARVQFALMFIVQLAHRLVNRDFAGARGLLEGAAEAWRMR